MIRTMRVALALATITTASVSITKAQCVGLNPYSPTSLTVQQPSFGGSVRFASSTSGFDHAVADAQAANEEPVVGFWSVKLTAKGNAGVPDGTIVDSGYSQWHSDHTEITNSSRPPTTQSFCLGVWERTGPSRYRLNHFAISWNPDGTLLGPANLREEITVSADHNSFEGTFTIEQYNPKGTLVSQVAGQIQGKRITLSTSIKDIL